MTTLALDLGQHLGWVCGNAVGPLEHGTYHLPETTDLGAWLTDVGPAMYELMEGVDDIAVEMPYLGDSYYVARKLLGALGLVYVYARMRGIGAKHVNEIPVSTGKLALAGHGHADKDRMIAAACAQFGWEAHEIDEHQADAAGIFYVHLFGAAAPPRRKARSGPGRSLLRGPAVRP